MKKILTGLQPTGIITIGNYLGSLKQMVNMQGEYESIIFLPDMHAITVEQDPQMLHKNIRELTALYLACGIDPEKNMMFLQSENEFHAGVSWMLECTTPYGELSRMTQFKDKSSKNVSFSAGLLTYPVLMAADILIYDVDYVPVGADQKQHVELARDIAIRFNKKYGETFKVPDVKITKSGTKIMDLVNPVKNNTVKKEIPMLFLLTLLLTVLYFDSLFDSTMVNQIGRADGIIIILFFMIFVYYLISYMRKKQNVNSSEEPTREFDTFKSKILNKLL